MARNIEIKARIASIEAVACLAAPIADEGPVTIAQDDYIVGQTRVHLDTVQDLGTFMELEVVLREGESAGQGEREAQRIMRLLQIRPGQLVDVAYVDLLRTGPSRAA